MILPLEEVIFDGSVTIHSRGQLDDIAHITFINGDLLIFNTSLGEIPPLRLEHVTGSVIIQNNHRLTSLAGLVAWSSRKTLPSKPLPVFIHLNQGLNFQSLGERH
ncbi:MAG: hypothetical protein GY822_31630 [Deltaproteobacteria bacterium]|nr:hypothetical protein [Deltaproteobacteria bacterium]